MKALLNFVIAILVPFVGAAAQESPNSQIPAPFFFKVTKAGTESYILGTVHTGISLNDFGPIIQQRIRQSDELLVEWVFQKRYVDLFYSDPWAFKEAVEREILGEPFTHHPNVRPSEQTLAKLLSLGLPSKYLDKIRIDMCGVAVHTVDTYAIPKSLNFDILELAYSINKKLIQLDGQEVLDEERADVSNYYACNLDNFLHDNQPNSILQDEAMKKSKYLAGDLSFVHIEDDPDTYEKRTLRWLPKILEALEKGNVFIGVGAGHTVGEKGLKKLLEARGYRLEPES